MKSIPLTSPRPITETIKSEKLLNVTLETGSENIYIPEKNKFIVTNSFLQKRVDIFYICGKLYGTRSHKNQIIIEEKGERNDNNTIP